TKSIWSRMFRHLECVGELERIDRLFGDGPMLPMLAKAVIDAVGVRDLPYTDVPRICSALYMLKEFWRERLLMALIDDAISCIKNEVGRPPLIHGQSRVAFFYDRAA